MAATSSSGALDDHCQLQETLEEARCRRLEASEGKSSPFLSESRRRA